MSLGRQIAIIQGDKIMKRWVVNILGRKGYKSVRIGAYTRNI
ncbi:hypothetical protein YBT1518_34491 (plasmid) [Bacillus thuringiensis YBT-1518]|uniref:Uncharacterized protein n=1 Tax=Bacillus thuringiensis YBT-1518 TaxID=529122 RepID=A0A9W3KIS9_BACTU|nr:hypothetical protein YBT1518_34491 [Bacillus thuringiensis YBT-1518]